MLYVVCGVTDFAAFVVVFVVSRGLAESRASPTWLGIVGGGLAFSQGVGSVLGGWLSHRFDDRLVFVGGALLTLTSVAGCAALPPTSPAFLAAYWLMGIGLGCLYPPLIGWLNEGRDASTDRSGVSRTLILFCLSWNLGMMAGQLTAGSLFARSRLIALWVSLGMAAVNVALATWAAVMRSRLALMASQRAEDANGSSAEEPIEPPRLARIFKRLSWQANLAGMFGGSMVIHLLPDLAVRIGVPAGSHGSILATWRVVVIATYFVMHLVPYWHYRLSVALVSQAVAATGLLVVWRAESAPQLLVGLTMLGQLVGYNYFAGLYYSAAGSSQTGRALAAGLHEATLAAGMAAGTMLGGLLGQTVDFRFPYLLAALVAVALMGVQAMSYRLWMPAAIELPTLAPQTESPTGADE